MEVPCSSIWSSILRSGAGPVLEACQVGICCVGQTPGHDCDGLGIWTCVLHGCVIGGPGGGFWIGDGVDAVASCGSCCDPEMADGASVSPFVVLRVAPMKDGVVCLVLASKGGLWCWRAVCGPIPGFVQVSLPLSASWVVEL